eukprot:1161401-Pelagomonas_calceolata.AAC.2
MLGQRWEFKWLNFPMHCGSQALFVNVSIAFCQPMSAWLSRLALPCQHCLNSIPVSQSAIVSMFNAYSQAKHFFPRSDDLRAGSSALGGMHMPFPTLVRVPVNTLPTTSLSTYMRAQVSASAVVNGLQPFSKPPRVGISAELA